MGLWNGRYSMVRNQKSPVDGGLSGKLSSCLHRSKFFPKFVVESKTETMELAKQIVNERKTRGYRVTSAKKAANLIYGIANELGYNQPRITRTEKKRTKEIDNVRFESESVNLFYNPKKKRLFVTWPESKFNAETTEKMNKLIPQREFEILAGTDRSELSMEQQLVRIKLFNPVGVGSWYIYDHIEDDIFMALAVLDDPSFGELGTVSLRELSALELGLGAEIERDKFFLPRSLAKVYDEVKNLQTF